MVWYAARMPRRGPLDPDDVSPIARDVPLPAKRNEALRRYPFADMQPGDSFTVPADRMLSARAAASRFQQGRQDWQFVTRIEGERGRIWRVK
jgi:hypothetical protein